MKLYIIPYNIFHALSTVSVLLITCMRDKTNTKQTHTIINIFIQSALKIINKIKIFILHLLKYAVSYGSKTQTMLSIHQFFIGIFFHTRTLE